MTPSLEPLSAEAPVLVAGGGVTGRAVLAALSRLGATATLCDDAPATRRQFADSGTPTEDSASAAAHIEDYALVITSPGFPPTAPVPAAAAAAGVPVWGDVELAWRLDQAGHYGPPRRWLVVTGTNGKTTTTSMLHAMLVAAGLGSRLCGNIGSPVLSALSGGPHGPADVLTVELSSFQLHWAPSLRPEAGVVLNIAEDHLDWHGTLVDYAAAKAGVLRGRVAVAGLDDPRAAELLAVAPAPVRVGFRLGEPAAGELGVRDGVLVDCAFTPPGIRRRRCRWPRSRRYPVPGPGGGARRARRPPRLPAASGCPPRRLRPRWHRFRSASTALSWWPSSIRSATSTTPRPPTRTPPRPPLLAYPRVVWIAGGLLKGASVDETVARVASATGRSGVDRPRPGDGCRGVIATRAGCAGRTGCDRRGYRYACDCCVSCCKCDKSGSTCRTRLSALAS